MALVLPKGKVATLMKTALWERTVEGLARWFNKEARKLANVGSGLKNRKLCMLTS